MRRNHVLFDVHHRAICSSGIKDRLGLLAVILIIFVTVFQLVSRIDIWRFFSEAEGDPEYDPEYDPEGNGSFRCHCGPVQYIPISFQLNFIHFHFGV